MLISEVIISKHSNTLILNFIESNIRRVVKLAVYFILLDTTNDILEDPFTASLT